MNQAIVIVGNGIAAINAIKAIREEDQETKIRLYGKEEFHPYNRIKLSKELLGNLAEDNVLLQNQEWYQENNVDLQLNTEVTGINSEQKQVILDDKSEVNFSKLLLATGADNSTPPIEGIEKEGVFTLRTLADAQQINDYAEQSNNILIIGGGIQGLETAWILAQAGKNVELVETCSQLMAKELDQKSAEILKQSVEEVGIKVQLSTEIKKIVGEKNVEGFITGSGNSGDCDMVIYSTGIEPNLNLVEGIDIKRNKGIIVDPKMETNIPDIYAAGDVIEFNNRIYGLWNLAINQGKVAGYNIIGEEKYYEHIIPLVTLRAFNLNLFSMGLVEADQATDFIVEQNEAETTYSKIFIKDNLVIGAIVIGDIRKSPVLKKAIEQEIDISTIDYKNVSIDQFLEMIRNK